MFAESMVPSVCASLAVLQTQKALCVSKNADSGLKNRFLVLNYIELNHNQPKTGDKNELLQVQ